MRLPTPELCVHSFLSPDAAQATSSPEARNLTNCCRQRSSLRAACICCRLAANMPWQRASRSVLLVIEAVCSGCACVASFLRITWAATRKPDMLRSIAQRNLLGYLLCNAEDEIPIVASEQCKVRVLQRMLCWELPACIL